MLEAWEDVQQGGLSGHRRNAFLQLQEPQGACQLAAAVAVSLAMAPHGWQRGARQRSAISWGSQQGNAGSDMHACEGGSRLVSGDLCGLG